MDKQLIVILLLLAALVLIIPACDEPADEDDDDDEQPVDDDDDDTDDDDEQQQRAISHGTLQDKILGSWVGQMAGVTWGASTEFLYPGVIIPENEVPQWNPGMINYGFIQDDVYVEIPFIDVMREHGVTANWLLFGEAFRDTNFPLAHANLAARKNLRNGIPAPDSGHYANNEHCDDIDWQIESDFVGTLCPGLNNQAIEIAWRAGHVMNYGDGVLGGVFMAAMHAESFFAQDLAQIIEAGRQALPPGSKYRAVVEDMLDWHEQGQTWEQSWQLLQDKWGHDDRCPDFQNPIMDAHNIDAKLNGAYVLLGLLYGEGDLERSMLISMRCGQDSDCNPSSVGAIIGNWLGYGAIPDQYKSGLRSTEVFMFTDYTLDQAIEANLELAREVMLASGCTVQGDGQSEVWLIPPAEQTVPPILEQWPVESNAPPALSAAIASQNGLRVTLKAQAEDDDGVLNFQWYFGDLTRAQGEQVEHAYAAAGTYQAIAYVTDGVGNTSWQALEISVAP
ncbi:MAG: ADP-ribosylglycohydrolase family protein [Candidatus Alcyoniella australis]|nr:ADP-ribosylglycohydrolase family protein [Candidatus Alcyoniella australis]